MHDNGACPDNRIEQLLRDMQAQPDTALQAVQSCQDSFPRDGRLHFLRGSLLATAKDYEGARNAMEVAVAQSPYLWIARFQLGLLELTCGDAALASSTWAPLSELHPENALRSFAAGLGALIREAFDEAILLLQEGIALNSANPPLNNDMQLIIDRILEIKGQPLTADEPTSATQILLQRFGKMDTKH